MLILWAQKDDNISDMGNSDNMFVNILCWCVRNQNNDFFLLWLLYYKIFVLNEDIRYEILYMCQPEKFYWSGMIFCSIFMKKKKLYNVPDM